MASNIKLKTKLVKPNFSISLKQEQKSLIDYVMDDLKGVDIQTLKLDADFIKYICEIIENQVNTKKADKDAKPNKLDIFVEIIKKLFPNISESDVTTCKNLVEFLLKNKLIKKTKLSKIFSFYLKKKFSLSE